MRPWTSGLHKTYYLLEFILIRLRIGIIGESLWMGHLTSGFHKPWSLLIEMNIYLIFLCSLYEGDGTHRVLLHDLWLEPPWLYWIYNKRIHCKNATYFHYYLNCYLTTQCFERECKNGTSEKIHLSISFWRKNDHNRRVNLSAKTSSRAYPHTLFCVFHGG